MACAASTARRSSRRPRNRPSWSSVACRSATFDRSLFFYRRCQDKWVLCALYGRMLILTVLSLRSLLGIPVAPTCAARFTGHLPIRTAPSIFAAQAPRVPAPLVRGRVAFTHLVKKSAESKQRTAQLGARVESAAFGASLSSPRAFSFATPFLSPPI
jgi:hypothetical protein